jgi:hypothetical protein
MLVTLWLAGYVWADERVFIHSASAQLFETPSFSSSVIVELNRGEFALVMERQKRWVEVEWNDQRGWLSVLLVRNSPPIPKIQIFSDDAIQIQGSTRIRASEVATAGATRGLTSDANALSSTGFDLKEVEVMEALKSTETDVAQFFRGGD